MQPHGLPMDSCIHEVQCGSRVCSMKSVACAQEEDKVKRKAELTADYEEKMAAKKAMREEEEEEEEEPEEGTCV